MRILLVAGALAAFALPVASSAQAPVHLADVMSAADMQATGVSSLSADQRAALEAWLGRYSRTIAAGNSSSAATGEMPSAASGGSVASGDGATQVFRPARNPTPGSYRITSVANGGRTITLEDGSIWEVYAPDRPMTAAWKVSDAVIIRRSSAIVDDIYDFKMIDGPSGRTATVRWAGR